MDKKLKCEILMGDITSVKNMLNKLLERVDSVESITQSSNHNNSFIITIIYSEKNLIID